VGETVLQVSVGTVAILVLSIMGWWIKRVSDVSRDLTTLKENLPKEYVLKDDYYREIGEIKEEIHKMREEIKEGFKRLEEKLERKADKA